jgi:hypothetical protein
MADKNRKGFLRGAADFTRGALASVAGIPGDLEWMARNPRQAVEGLLSLGELFNPETLRTISRADVPAPDSGTVFPTSDQLVSKMGGSPYGLPALAGMMVGLPKLSSLGLSRKLAELPAAERLEKIGATQKTLDSLARESKQGRGVGLLAFSDEFSPEQATITREAAERGKQWLWEGIEDTPVLDPEQVRFQRSSVYEKRIDAPPVPKEVQGRSSAWYRGRDVEDVAKAAEKSGLHIDAERVGRALGLQRPLRRQDLLNIRNGLLNLLEYGERVVPPHSKEFYPEAEDVTAALAAGDPRKARELAIVFGSTSPNTSVESSIGRGYSILTPTEATQADPFAHARGKGGAVIANVNHALKNLQNLTPSQGPKVNAFTAQMDPTVGGLMRQSGVFSGTVNDTHIYQLAFWLAHKLVEVDENGVLRFDKKRYDQVRRAAAKDLMSPGDYKEYLKELKKNPDLLPAVNAVSDPLHRFLDAEIATVTTKLENMPPDRAQAVLWAVKQIVEKLQDKGAVAPADVLQIRNEFSNLFSTAVQNASGVLPEKAMHGSNVSRMVAEASERGLKDVFDERMGAEHIPQMLRDAGLISPDITGKPGFGSYKNPQGIWEHNKMFPIAFGTPREGGAAAKFYDDVVGPVARTVGRLGGQNAVAPGWFDAGAPNAIRVQAPSTITYDQWKQLMPQLRQAGLPPDIVDRRGFNPVITDFDEGAPQGVALERAAAQVEGLLRGAGIHGATAKPVNYASRYENVITSPVRGTGEVTQQIVKDARENKNVRGLLEGEGVGRYAEQALRGLQSMEEAGFSKGLGPEFAINAAYENLYNILKRAPAGQRRRILERALKSGVPLPVIVLVVQTLNQEKEVA